jgi:xylan 1,4-beta-xylosidase
VALRFTHTGARAATVQSIDAEHGNVQVAYERMGSPRYPTQRELAQLREAAALPPATNRPLQSGELDLEIPSDGLVLVTVPAAP